MIILLFLFVGGLALIHGGLKKYLLLRKIEDTPPSKVDAASVGLLKLSGTAQFFRKEESPVNHSPCAFWRVTGEFFKEGKNGGWRIIYTADSRSMFFLADETGRLLVAPDGAQINIPSCSTHKGYIRDTEGWLESHKVTMDGTGLKFIESLDETSKKNILAHQDEEIRVKEFIIRENDPLFVLGTGTPVEDVQVPGSGDLIVRKGTNDKTMYIGDTGEGYVIDKLSSGVYLPIFVGLALSGVCLTGLLLLLGV